MEYLPCVGYWVGLWRYNKREKQVQSFSGLILKQTLIKELINTCTRRLWEGPPRHSPGAVRAGGQENWPGGRWRWRSPELEGDGFSRGRTGVPSCVMTPSHHSFSPSSCSPATSLIQSMPTVSSWSHILFILPPNGPSTLTPFSSAPALYIQLYISPPVSSKDLLPDVLSSSISLQLFTHPGGRDLPPSIGKSLLRRTCLLFC